MARMKWAVRARAGIRTVLGRFPLPLQIHWLPCFSLPSVLGGCTVGATSTGLPQLLASRGFGHCKTPTEVWNEGANGGPDVYSHLPTGSPQASYAPQSKVTVFLYLALSCRFC